MNSFNLDTLEFPLLHQLGVSRFNNRLEYYRLGSTHGKSLKAQIQTTDSSLRSSSALTRITILNFDVADDAQMQLLGCNREEQEERHSSKVIEVTSKINAMHLLCPKFSYRFSNNDHLFCKEGKFLYHAILHHNPHDPHTPPHPREFVSLPVQTRTSP
jgi:hypothetical protein